MTTISAKPPGHKPYIRDFHPHHTRRSQPLSPVSTHSPTTQNQISILAIIQQQWQNQRTRPSTTRPTRVNSRPRFRCNLWGWDYGGSGEFETDRIFDEIQPTGTASRSLRHTDTLRLRELTPSSEGITGTPNSYIFSCFDMCTDYTIRHALHGTMKALV